MADITQIEVQHQNTTRVHPANTTYLSSSAQEPAPQHFPFCGYEPDLLLLNAQEKWGFSSTATYNSWLEQQVSGNLWWGLNPSCISGLAELQNNYSPCHSTNWNYSGDWMTICPLFQRTTLNSFQFSHKQRRLNQSALCSTTLSKVTANYSLIFRKEH